MSAYALIADADPQRLGFYRSIVQQEGLEPVTTRDGNEARLLLRRRGAPALLLTDLSLPGADGFALLAELRKLAPEERAPAVVVSAFLGLRDEAYKRRDALGITELLPKSASAGTVQRTVYRALTQPRAARPQPPDAGSPPRREQPPTQPLTQQAQRLAALEASGLADPAVPQDPELEKLLRETAASMGVSMAFINLVARDRLFFKGHVGLSGPLAEERGTDASGAFCRHVVDAGGRETLVVPDARSSPLFQDYPVVREGLVRAYAGAPLVTSQGHVLGTLCVMDGQPQQLRVEQVEQLQALARRVAGELELRARTPRGAFDEALARLLQGGAGGPGAEGAGGAVSATQRAVAGTLDTVREVLDALDTGVALSGADGRVVLASRGLGALLGAPAAGLVGLTHEELAARLAALCADPEGVRRRLAVPPRGPFVVREELALERPGPCVVRWVARPVRLPDGSAGQVASLTELTRAGEDPGGPLLLTPEDLASPPAGAPAAGG
jgi:GAF domain-containing protein